MLLSTVSALNAQKKAAALASTPRLDHPPKHPMILCHGLFGFDTISNIVDYWNDIPSALTAAGAEVFVARVPATSSVETRAGILVQQIATRYPNRSVHLIGHSMGGLDCRYLTTHLLDGAGFEVLSITTLATPHWGSPAADLLATTHAAENPVARTLMNMVPAGDGDGQAFVSLSTATAHDFNMKTVDRPGVRYFSYGCTFNPGVVDAVAWGPTHAHISLVEGENDGVVSLKSAQWGEYLGTIRGVNHTEIIGHKFTNTRTTDVLDILGGKAPFNPKQLMVQHASKLATEVETGYGF
ncbi:lipase 2 [Marasmius tenuissimus]|uniref:GPI inositol-deacylase n=1 Tax=Marasmius tenuissimus TaxID=585030 RepID=A0ABR2ZGB7_9AGAR|nr:lipase 2 [Marasmius tenuissimus]